MRNFSNSTKPNIIQQMHAIVVFLLVLVQHGFAQNPLLGIGNKVCDMNDVAATITTQVLPTPPTCCGYNSTYFYQGNVSALQQTVQFDQYGELLFFIVDGAIFDRDGYIIAKAGNCTEDLCEPCLWNESHQVIATPYPGMCDRFIIIRDYGSEILFSFLDFTLPNCHFPDRQGALIDAHALEDGVYPELDFYSLNYDNIEFHDGYSFTFQPFNDVKVGAMHMDLIEKPNNTGKLLFVVRQGEYAIIDINASGLDVLSTFQYTTSTYQRHPEGECEIGFDSNTNEYLIAFTTAEAGYFEAGLNLNNDVNLVLLRMGSNGIVNNIHGYQPAFEPVQTVSNSVAGLEFSPNGQYLYFSQHREPMVGYISLSDGVTHGMPYTIANISNYDNTRIEGNKAENGADNAIYFLGHDNSFAAISGANNPATSAWITNVNTSLSIGTVPQYNAFSNNEVYDFKNIQTQTFNAPEIVNFLSSQGCCLAHSNVIATPRMTITTAYNGTWTYGDNPFDDSMVPVRIVGDLIFEPGTDISINNMVLEFDEDANMIMKPRSKVSLNGSTLTSLSCSNIMWPGVDLLGTTNSTSTIDQTPMTGGGQGYLSMNNSTIEHAKKAVEVGTLVYNTGGIIRAYNSTFRNNQYDVIFQKYHFITGSGVYFQNRSRFNNCTFITDAHLNDPILAPIVHVSLIHVDKVYFTNCSFMNTTPLTIYNWKARGTGIFSWASSFHAAGLNDSWSGQNTDPDQTTFYKLQYGIYSSGSNNPLSFYTCRKQEFQQCLYGIVNNNTDNVQIYQNNFQLPEAVGFSADETMERGIYLSNSTGYTVEQNVFDGYNDPAVNGAYPCALGIWVDNSGDAANQIRNNDFDEMKLGTYVTRNNKNYVLGVDEPGEGNNDGKDQTGLQLFCNTYTSGQTDIFRDSETLMRQDQGGNQPGNTNLRAGNRFSAPNCDGANSDFVVDPYNNFYTEYHCHDQANTIPDCGGTSDHPDIPPTNLLPVEVLDLVPYSDTDCPNTFGGPIITGPNPGVISGLIGELQTVRDELQDAKDTYLQVVDRNQKQSTLDILSEAFPHESQFYRDLLMQRYPLSDEVLKRLIMEASRLSSWHLTEVFLANSPLSKEILYKIDEANILTSFFMSFLYNADSGASLRRLMELNMLSLATERDQLIQSIARAGLTYETDAESEADQPIYVHDYLAQLALQDGSTALRIRAAYLAAKGDYNSAIALIANEPLLFSYQTILQMEQSVSGDWSLLSESQISALWDIYNSKKDYSSSMALSILQQIGAADFEPEPRVPIQYRSLQIAKDDENVALPLLGVWPNPASNSAWLHYPIEADEHATIEVYDPQGRLLNSFQPNTNGLVELSLKSYESGIYVVQLIAFDKVVESIKLSVVNQD